MPKEHRENGLERRRESLEAESRVLERRAAEIKKEREETVRTLRVVEEGVKKLRTLEEEEAALKARQLEIDREKQRITEEIRKTIALRKKSEEWGPVSSAILEQDIVRLEKRVSELAQEEQKVQTRLDDCRRRMRGDGDVGKISGMPKSPVDSISQEEMESIVGIIAELAATAPGGARQFFKDVVLRTPLPKDWKYDLDDVWTGSALRDARTLCEFAGRKRNPADTRHTVLASFLIAVRRDAGADQRVILDRYIACLTFSSEGGQGMKEEVM